MKIKNKLFLSNILVSLLVVLLISIGIAYVINNYIISEVTNQLVVDNNRMFDFIEILSGKGMDDETITFDTINSKFKDKMKSPLVKQRLDISHFVVIEEPEPRLLYASYFEGKEQDYVLEEVSRIKTLGVYQGHLFGKPMIIYKDRRFIQSFGEGQEVIIYSMVYNELIREIMTPLILILIVVVVIGIILLILITRALGTNFTRPIDALIEMSEKIGQKESIESLDIASNDEFQKLGKALQSMATVLDEKDRLQTCMYEQLSHDFKTPLTVISGYAEGVMGDIFDDDDVALTTIIEECTKLRKQVEDVIYISRLDDIRDSYELKDANLTEVLGDCINRFSGVYAVKNIDVVYEPLKSFAYQVDPMKFDRMLDNIFSNCLRYAKACLWVEVTEVEGVISITIEDDGDGFCDALLEEYLDLGQMQSQNGLGLLIINKIVEGHHGELELTNTEKGAKYTIRLMR